MKNTNPISAALIAPCGMNCALCSRYLAFRHDINRSQCRGCRSRQEPCHYLFEKCTGLNHAAGGDVAFCFACAQYPCQQIKRMDARYRKNYGMSVLENLAYIQQRGLPAFIAEQYARHRCTRCGGLISVHNRKCFKCDPVTRLVEKRHKQY